MSQIVQCSCQHIIKARNSCKLQKTTKLLQYLHHEEGLANIFVASRLGFSRTNSLIPGQIAGAKDTLHRYVLQLKDIMENKDRQGGTHVGSKPEQQANLDYCVLRTHRILTIHSANQSYTGPHIHTIMSCVHTMLEKVKSNRNRLMHTTFFYSL